MGPAQLISLLGNPGGRGPLESADPRGPARVAMVGEGLRRKSVSTGVYQGRGPLRTMGQTSLPWGASWAIKTRRSCRRESNFPLWEVFEALRRYGGLLAPILMVSGSLGGALLGSAGPFWEAFLTFRGISFASFM